MKKSSTISLEHIKMMSCTPRKLALKFCEPNLQCLSYFVFYQVHDRQSLFCLLISLSISCSLRNFLLGSHNMSFKVAHPISRLSAWSCDPDPPSESTLTTWWVQRRALDRQSQHHGRGRLIFQMGWFNYSEAFSTMPVIILPSQELSRK